MNTLSIDIKLGFLIVMSATVLFTGCSIIQTTPKVMQKKPSKTLLSQGNTPLKHYLHKTDKKLSNNSAFYTLDLPVDAFAARLFLIDNAKKSLDVQYYIYEDDTIGKVFSAHLLLAANRGVRVRILLDDLSTSGKDVALKKLALHPNVELRLFNPNKLRTSFRNLGLLFNVNSLGKRMHNKSLIADGYAAILGGRNIGDVYFAATYETLFLDYDVISIGKVVPDISYAFDIYWNSEQSVPLDQVVTQSHLKYKDFEKIFLETLNKRLKVFEKDRFGIAVKKSKFMQKIKTNTLRLTVSSRADLYYDDPSKVVNDENDNSTHISKKLSKDLRIVTSDLIVISPYFVPSNKMMEQMKDLRSKGVKITIITNSLASTDVFPVYAGYQGYIKTLVQMGVSLYELNPHGFTAYLEKKELEKIPKLSLHTKMIMMDEDILAVGSANIDPRSDKLNTELLMIITSKKLTKKERKSLNNVLNLNNFYKLSWGEYPKLFDDDPIEFGPIWHTIKEGKKIRYYERPEVGFFKLLGTDLMAILPIKGYL